MTQPVALGPSDQPSQDMRNPHAEGAALHATEWCLRHGLTDTAIRDIHIADLVGRTYPTADEATLSLLACWMVWIFLVDDYWEHAPLSTVISMSARLMRLVETPVTGLSGSNDSFSVSLGDLSVRMSQKAWPVWMSRFRNSLNDYFVGVTWEANNRACAQAPSVDEYIFMRRRTIGTPQGIDLIELVNGSDLTQLRLEPDIRAFEITTATLTASQNDVYSFRKESHTGQAHNLVHVIAHRQRCSLEEALGAAIRIRDANAARFIEQRNRLCRNAALPAAASRFLEGFDAMARTCERLGLDPRYR